MEHDELDRRARALYDSRPSRPHCPPWDLLGNVTRGVWHGYVLDGQEPDQPQKTGDLPAASSNNEGNR